MTSLNDTRVLYREPAKWIAKLQAGASGGPFLLKTEMVRRPRRPQRPLRRLARGGHGAGLDLRHGDSGLISRRSAEERRGGPPGRTSWADRPIADSGRAAMRVP